MLRAALILAFVSGVAGMSAHAPDQERPTFEVASVKPRTLPGTTLSAPQGARPGGAFGMVNSTVARLVMYAYDLPDYQVIGGPAWVRTDRFDISARAGRDASIPDTRRMLQSLLEERFKLRTHTEQREMTIYRLVMARGDGRLGPNITKSDDDCKRLVQRPPNVPAGAVTVTGCSTVAHLARSSAQTMAAPVTDATELVGQFEYAFYYSSGGGGLVAATSVSPDIEAPSFPTALQEQLGLKLESTRGLVEVLAIDAVERPTPD
jgi:uncharacterized protein (TIGR03435 family)